MSEVWKGLWGYVEKCLLEGSGFSVTISSTYFQAAQLNVNQHQIQVQGMGSHFVSPSAFQYM